MHVCSAQSFSAIDWKNIYVLKLSLTCLTHDQATTRIWNLGLNLMYNWVPLKKLNRLTFLSWVTYTSVCLKLPTFFKSNAKNFCANQKCVFLKILKSPATNHVMHLKFYLWRCFWICIRWIYCFKFFFEIKF